MDWLPEWGQIAVSVAVAVAAGLGAYWRIVLRVGKAEDRMAVMEKDIRKNDERVTEELSAMEGTTDKLLEKAESRDSQLTEHGAQLREIKTALDIHIPALSQAIAGISDKLDKLK